MRKQGPRSQAREHSSRCSNHHQVAQTSYSLSQEFPKAPPPGMERENLLPTITWANRPFEFHANAYVPRGPKKEIVHGDPPVVARCILSLGTDERLKTFNLLIQYLY